MLAAFPHSSLSTQNEQGIICDHVQICTQGTRGNTTKISKKWIKHKQSTS